MGTLGELVDDDGDLLLSMIVGTVAVVVADLPLMVCIWMFPVEGTLVVEVMLNDDERDITNNLNKQKREEWGDKRAQYIEEGLDKHGLRWMDG